MATTEERPVPPQERKRLGEIITRVCSLEPQQVEGAAVAARQFGERLGRFLLRCGLVTPSQLCHALAVQSGLATVDLLAIDVPESLNKLFPFTLLKENNCVPFAETRTTVSIAVAEPLHQSLVKTLEDRCKKKVQQFVGEEDLIAKQLDVIYKGAKPRKYTRYSAAIPLEYRFCTRLGRPLDDEIQYCTTLNISEGGMAVRQDLPAPKEIERRPRHDVYTRAVLKDPLKDIEAICQLRWIRQPGTSKEKAYWSLGLQIVEISPDDEVQLQSLCRKLSKRSDVAQKAQSSFERWEALNAKTEMLPSVQQIEPAQIHDQLRALGISEEVLILEQPYEQFIQEKGIKTLGQGSEGAVYFLRGHVVKVTAPEGTTAALREIAHMLHLNALRQSDVLGDRKRQDFPCLLWIYILSNGSLAVGMKPFDMTEMSGSATMHERLKHGRAMDRIHAMLVLRSVAQTLGHMHASGLIHHDLKPANIFVPADPRRSPVVFDFGQSLLRLNQWGRGWLKHQHNLTSWYSGTYRYMHKQRRSAHLGAIAALGGRQPSAKQAAALDEYVPSFYDDVFAFARIIHDYIRNRQVRLEPKDVAVLTELYQDLMGIKKGGKAPKASGSGFTAIFRRFTSSADPRPEHRWPSMEQVSAHMERLLDSM